MSEKIHISEIDDSGVAVDFEELAAELPAARRINPWLISLWVLSGISAIFTLLGFMGSGYSYIGAYNVVPPATIDQRPWFAVLSPYIALFMIMAFLGVLGTLVLHAVFWERRAR